MSQSASDAMHGEGRAKIIQATGLKEHGQVRRVPGLCTHSGTHGVITSLGSQA